MLLLVLKLRHHHDLYVTSFLALYFNLLMQLCKCLSSFTQTIFHSCFSFEYKVGKASEWVTNYISINFIIPKVISFGSSSSQAVSILFMFILFFYIMLPYIHIYLSINSGDMIWGLSQQPVYFLNLSCNNMLALIYYHWNWKQQGVDL